MSFPRYPEYKDSGVEWLGEVPARWDVRRLRYSSTLNPSKSEVRGLPGDTLATFLPMEAVGEDGSLDTRSERPLGDVIDGYTYLREDDVAYAKITPCFENGKAALIRGTRGGIAFGTTEFTVLRPIPKVSIPEYLFRVISAEPFRRLGEASMYGAGGQKRVPDDFARDFSIAWPPVAEQRTIAAFLDHETARIDALIEEQQRLIELLKEKRQAVISHAVTKGLDPDLPMKDSGVEWLGVVPAHWDVSRVGWMVSDLTYGFTNPMPTESNGPAMLTANDIGWGCVYYDEARSTSEEAYEFFLTSKSKPKKNDVLLTKDGTLGRVGVHDGRAACINQSVALLRPFESVCLSDFLCLVLQASCYQERMVFDAGGTTIKHIYITRLAKMEIAVPPLGEQVEILRNAGIRDREYWRIIDDAERMTRLLRERRSALISAAVTGKIDVRGWQPPVSDTESPRHTTSELPA